MIAAQKRSSVADPPAKLDFCRGMPPSLTAYLMVAPGQLAGSGEASPSNNIVPPPWHHIGHCSVTFGGGDMDLPVHPVALGGGLADVRGSAAAAVDGSFVAGARRTMTIRNVTGLVFGLFTSIGLIRAASADGHAAAGMFQEMDVNGDGKVSPGEHAAAARKMFETMDGNGDGKVTAAEMTAARDPTKSHRVDATEMSSADKIKVIDTNGDGMLSAEEHAAGAKMMFDKMDTNHDGSLTASELAAGHAKMMPKRSK